MSTSLPPVVLNPEELILDGCEALHTLRDSVSNLVGAKPPAGWGSGPTPITEVVIELYECERISLAHFERGPIQFLVEVHGNRDPPPTCTGGDYTSSEIISFIGINDEKLATYLADRLGLPAMLTPIERITESLPAGNQMTWTVKPASFPESTLQITSMKEPDITGTYNYRRFWTNHVGGISHFDFVTTYRRGNFDWPLATGEIQDPFLHVPGITQYVAAGNFLHEASVRAPIQEFGDMSCEFPLR